MNTPSQNISNAEWNVMECLWEHSPRTGREAVEYLKETVGWSRSTTLTMLGRMAKKGLIDCHEVSGVLVYAPLLDREDAVHRETEGFVERVYKGSISMLMSAITQKQNLSGSEIDELYEILSKAKEEKNND